MAPPFTHPSSTGQQASDSASSTCSTPLHLPTLIQSRMSGQCSSNDGQQSRIVLNIDDRFSMLQQLWEDIPQAHIDNAINSMPKRLKDVVRKGGFALGN